MFKKIYLFGFNYQFVVDNLFYCLSWNENDFEYRVNVTKRGKLQRGMLLLWFSRGHVVMTLHSHNTASSLFQSKREVHHNHFSLKSLI